MKFDSKIVRKTINKAFLKEPIERKKTTKLEKVIDRMVYELYGLSEEEVRIVEGDKIIK